MVEYQADQLDAVFQALADPTRRAILARLAESPGTVGEVAAPFEMSLQGVSKHLRVLERAGLVGRDIDGRRHVCRAEPKALEPARDWLRYYERFWTERLDSLEEFLSLDTEDEDDEN